MEEKLIEKMKVEIILIWIKSYIIKGIEMGEVK